MEILLKLDIKILPKLNASAQIHHLKVKNKSVWEIVPKTGITGKVQQKQVQHLHGIQMQCSLVEMVMCMTQIWIYPLKNSLKKSKVCFLMEKRKRNQVILMKFLKMILYLMIQIKMIFRQHKTMMNLNDAANQKISLKMKQTLWMKLLMKNKMKRNMI